jgi:GNAT superfamily N-acetyltransferase
MVRPLERGDREALRAAFDRLSPESRYRRFLSPLDRLSEDQLDYLTRLDHRDHEALAALTASCEGVGVARYVRLAEAPDSAEVAVAVADDWHGHGLGTRLLEELTDRARAEGVERFSATVLAENRDVIDLLRGLGGVTVRARGAGTLELDVELEEPEAIELEFDVAGEVQGDGLAGALRAAAAGSLRLPGLRRLEHPARSLRRRLS